MAGKHVITQAGSSALSALQDESKADVVNSFASLDEIADYNTAFMNLEAGTNDAIAVDIGVAQYQLTTKADKFRMLEEPLSTEQYAIGFKKGNEELRDQVQATLDEMAEDGTLAEIATKYKDYNLDQDALPGKIRERNSYEKKLGKTVGRLLPPFLRFKISQFLHFTVKKRNYEFCDYYTAAGKAAWVPPLMIFCADTAVFHALGAFGCLRAYVKNKALAGSH